MTLPLQCHGTQCNGTQCDVQCNGNVDAMVAHQPLRQLLPLLTLLSSSAANANSSSASGDAAAAAAAAAAARAASSSIAGPYHYDRSMMQIVVSQPSPTTLTVYCSMYGAPCPGRPGATGDGGNWSAASGTVQGGVLTATFDYHAATGGLNDTGTVKLNASGGPPTLGWKIAGTWNPGRGVLPPPPPSPPAHGYAVTVIERNVAPSSAGGSIISKENKTSNFTYNFNSAYFPANSQGGSDGLVVRVEDKQPGGKGSGIAVVRRVGGAAGSMKFEVITGASAQMILTCSKPATPASPCADDPRIIYRPKTETYYLTYDNTSGNSCPDGPDTR